MALPLITFSEYSESSNNQIHQISSSIPEKKQSPKSIQPNHLPPFPLISSVVHKINIGLEDFNACNSSKIVFLNQHSNKKKFTYKNGRKILISKGNTLLNNNSYKKPIVPFNLDSDSNDSYYNYSSSEYYYDESTSINNIPAIKSSNNQIKEENEKPNININNCFDIISINSNQQLPVLFDKYIVERKKNGISLLGKSIKFILKTINESLYIPIIEAVVNGSKINIIDTNTRDIIGSIKEKKNHSHFLIRKNFSNCYDLVIMDIVYTSYNNMKPRSSTINIYEPIFRTQDQTSNQKRISRYETYINNDAIINPNRLHSKNPKQNEFGTWNLDFGSRKIISSIKNSIIIDDDNKEYVIIGKISDNSLSVEVAKRMDPICVLGIAVSAYLNTKP